MLCAAISLYLADEYSTKIGKPLTILLISHQQEIYAKMDTFFRNYPELMERLRVKGDRMSMPLEGFQFKDNGSRVLMRLDTSHQVRGNDASMTIIDEAQSVEESIVFRDAMPTARKDMSKFVVVGTPESGTWFSEKIENTMKPKSDDHKLWKVSNYPSTVCPWLKDIIPIWKHELSLEDYTTEILAVTPDPQYSPPWSKRKLNKRYIDGTNTPLRRPNYYTLCGLDLGHGRTNKCALVSIERNKSALDCRAIHVELLNPNFALMVIRIKELNCKVCMVDSRPKELSDKVKMLVEPQCKGTKFYYVDAHGRKDAMLSQMVDLVHHNHITFPKPYCENLMKELLRYHRGKDRGCNLVDALVLACYQSPDYPLIPEKESPRGFYIGHRDVGVRPLDPMSYRRNGL
jgi:hypothetical protein